MFNFVDIFRGVLSSVNVTSVNFLTDRSKAVNLLRILFIMVFCVCLKCHTVLSVSYSLVVTYLERAYLLAILCVMLSCVFFSYPYGVLGQVWY